MPEAKPLLAEQLASDPRLAEARRLIAEAVGEHQAAVDGPRPADPARAAGHQQAVDSFFASRGAPLWYPYLGSGFGVGPLVELGDGSVKWDMLSGIGVHHFGHLHPEFVDAGLDAALSDTVMQGGFQHNADAAECMARFIRLAQAPPVGGGTGSSLSHCFLTTSGAMANENSFKMAFQKRALEGHPADRMLAFEGTFCGRTLALSAMSDKPGNRVGLPLAMNVDYVPFLDPADEAGSTQRAVKRLQEHLARWPGHHAGMKLELVIGEGGFYPGSRDFFAALVGPLKEAGVAVICDEIQTFGRTSRPFAFQHFGLDEHVDLVNVGKATQVCCTLFTDAWAPKPGLIAQTFSGATSSIRAGLRVLEACENGGLFETDADRGHVLALGDAVRGRVRAYAAKHPDRVTGPYGVGCMFAFQPGDGSMATARKLCETLFDAGLIAFVCGRAVTRVRFLLPAGGMSIEQGHAVCDLLEEVLDGFQW
ncbi:aminotransferase class III-fold pyridoxal phosphate-dependent enzyme [Phycisphaera mikurensis]|uniref:Putative aminotransferase n=1 Tax=Phycisphaera mikurensis (strain NBRC 102666 / KCTC 22515 / FYK2301M01) TaxID=1142394 RepID=I0IG25_PHYMF|nr:aminotransferase class III-fold pyridoxal phosphate-dependent enzyme [Phycisphaera mikurensis]MBB6440403.1 acetylornithine aminotransferase [Phycisphaera mikurensis]BAM04213.1 putative aminotransferase [Phycisphaera mikurensis NBRC 102666]